MFGINTDKTGERQQGIAISSSGNILYSAGQVLYLIRPYSTHQMNRRKKIEFGDFQTPRTLADDVCRFLVRRGIAPSSIIEPTCGYGTFVLASLDSFPSISAGRAVDISEGHLALLESELRGRNEQRIELARADFFTTSWGEELRSLPQPLLVIGNPPWVTNSVLAALNSDNTPRKSNFQNIRGIDAITGKSNFDIAEWMMLRLVGVLSETGGVLAMVCKTSVARKVLRYCWKQGINIDRPEIRHIDAMKHFGAAVDACLFVASFGTERMESDCPVFDSLESSIPLQMIAYRHGSLIADLHAFERWEHLRASSPAPWRSGVKHDCSKVMELYPDKGRYRNGLGEVVDLEPAYLFPMLKSSELTNGSTPTRTMIVTQKRIGEETIPIERYANKTWKYLMSHAEALDSRSSSIYRGKPRFSIFGVGDYTFAPFKVAISGFYKQLAFRVVGPHDGKPVVMDDTSYFLPFDTLDEAKAAAAALNSSIAREFFGAYLFWDTKRPVTIDILKMLDIRKLLQEDPT